MFEKTYLYNSSVNLALRPEDAARVEAHCLDNRIPSVKNSYLECEGPEGMQGNHKVIDMQRKTEYQQYGSGHVHLGQSRLDHPDAPSCKHGRVLDETLNDENVMEDFE